MMKKVSIDDLLSENQLELTIGGEKYVIQDVPMDVYLQAVAITEKSDKETDAGVLHQQLAIFIGVDEEKLSKIGIKAAGLAMVEIQKWMLADTTKLEEDLKEDVGP